MRACVRAIWLAACVWLGVPTQAADAATLDYRGRVLTSRQASRLARPALAAPSDSAATRRMLGTLIGQLQSLGYLDARAQAAWQDDAATLRLTVDEGPAYRFESVRLRSNAAEDSTVLARAFDLPDRAAASPPALGAAIQRALDRIVDLGYPYAVLGMSGWEQRDGLVHAEVSGALGPRVTISEVRFEGLEITRPDVAERAMGKLAGRPFNRRATAVARERLQQLGLFQTVEYLGLEGGRDWSEAQLVYRVAERRYNRFEGVIGVQGDAGTAGLADLQMENVLGTGRGFGLRWESRTQGRSILAAHYVEPMVLGAPLRLRLALDHEVHDTLFTQSRWGVRAGYALSGTERIEGGFEQERVVQDQLEVRQADLQNTVFAFERDVRDQAFAARRGTRARLSASQTFKTEKLRPSGTRSVRASAVALHAEWHQPWRRMSGFTWEIQLAGRFSTQRVLPLYERYPIGGASSLRGFDEEAFRVDRYALSRLEWRWFLGAAGQRAFLFWDHAWTATREPVDATNDRLDVRSLNGIGFGLRLQAAGGLIGLDYGLEPGRPPLEGKIHLKLLSAF